MTHTQPIGFLALPAAGNSRAVLVLHAWWGLNDNLKAYCSRLAEAGFIAFAPDLYNGQVTDIIAGAEALSNALDPQQAGAQVAAAVNFLNERFGPLEGGLAVVGFSLGAYFALQLSTMDAENIRSVVVYYGTVPGDYSQSRAAYLGHFAEQDPFEPLTEVERLENALQAAGRPVSFHIYPGTGHWFAEPDRPDAFNAEAARLAWERTLAFLGR